MGHVAVGTDRIKWISIRFLIRYKPVEDATTGYCIFCARGLRGGGASPVICTYAGPLYLEKYGITGPGLCLVFFSIYM